MGLGVGTNIGTKVGEGFWANADGEQSGEGVNSIRFRLRIGRE